MNFFTEIGNNNGVFIMFNENQLDGTYYTTEVLAQMSDFVGAPNSSAPFANANGVFENIEEAKCDFYAKIRKFILPAETGYEFKVRFFLNPSLTEEEAANIIKSGDINSIVSNPSTTEINEANDSNGFLAKLIG